MSTNRNKEQEQAHILADVRDYIKEEGVRGFILDLQILYPEVHAEFVDWATHRVNSLGQKEVPAVLRNYRK